mgnify:CR=1 FL=1
MLALGDNNLNEGLCIAINDTSLVYFSHYGVLTCGWGEYVMFQIGLKKWSLLNIYAPNWVKDRMVLWKSILSHLPTVDHWVIVGDINMLEDVCDRLGGIAHTLCGSNV